MQDLPSQVLLCLALMGKRNGKDFFRCHLKLPTLQRNNLIKVTYYLDVLLPCCEYTILMDETSTKGSLVCDLSYPVLRVWKDFHQGKPVNSYT